MSEMIELFPPKQKRPYRLSPAGLESLQAAIRRHRPWLKSRGPQTVPGKKRSSQNRLTHGLFTREFAAHRAGYVAALRQVKRLIMSERRRAIAEVPPIMTARVGWNSKGNHGRQNATY